MERVTRGEVRWCRFDPTNKTRPALILTREELIPKLNKLMIAEITSTIRGVASEVLLTEEDGMPARSVVNLHHVHSVDKTQVGHLITVVRSEKLLRVRAAMLFAAGFEP